MTMFVSTSGRIDPQAGDPDHGLRQLARPRVDLCAKRDDVVRERDPPGRCDHADLAHAASQALPGDARLLDELGASRTAASRPARPSPSRGKTAPSRTRQRPAAGELPSAIAALSTRAPSRWTGTPCAAPLAISALLSIHREHRAARVVVRVLEEHERDRRVVVGLLAAHAPRPPPDPEPRERPRPPRGKHAAIRRHRGQLVVVDVGCSPRRSPRCLAAREADRDQVAHRSGRNEQGRPRSPSAPLPPSGAR